MFAEPRAVLKDRRPHCSEPFLKMGGNSGRRPLSPSFKVKKGLRFEPSNSAGRNPCGHTPQLSEFIAALCK